MNQSQTLSPSSTTQTHLQYPATTSLLTQIYTPTTATSTIHIQPISMTQTKPSSLTMTSLSTQTPTIQLQETLKVFFTELDNISIIQHPNNSNTETNSTSSEKDTGRNENTRRISHENNPKSTDKNDTQKKTDSVFKTNQINNRGRTRSEDKTSKCCHNTALFHQTVEKPFNEFVINRTNLGKTLKSTSIKHKIIKCDTMYYYKIKSLIDMRSLINLLSQIHSENIIAPGWKSNILVTTNLLPDYFPCKILCKYKGEYHISFISELILNHINENNLDLIVSISQNILSKIACQTMKRRIHENTYHAMIILCRNVIIHSPGCINIK